MPENTYRFVYDQYGNTKKVKVFTRGLGVQSSNYTNKGTSFTAKERQELRLEGTPLRLELRSGANPYADRGNRLTSRQMRKRQRLKQFVTRKR